MCSKWAYACSEHQENLLSRTRSPCQPQSLQFFASLSIFNACLKSYQFYQNDHDRMLWGEGKLMIPHSPEKIQAEKGMLKLKSVLPWLGRERYLSISREFHKRLKQKQLRSLLPPQIYSFLRSHFVPPPSLLTYNLLTKGRRLKEEGRLLALLSFLDKPNRFILSLRSDQLQIEIKPHCVKVKLQGTLEETEISRLKKKELRLRRKNRFKDKVQVPWKLNCPRVMRLRDVAWSRTLRLK